MDRWLLEAQRVLDYPFLKIGNSELTLGTLAYALVLLIILVWFVALIRRWTMDRLLSRTQMDAHARQATATIVGYVLLFVGLMVILQTVGIDLTTLNVLAGAIGVGIGLGLQDVANNFISGLIILFERPIKVGDHIVVGDVDGIVAEIRGRSTTVVTFDNVAIIVPNSKFVTESVINWSYTDPKVRLRVPVGVAYGTDPKKVQQALLEAAAEVPETLDQPAPSVFFKEFGDSSLNFELRAWTTTILYQRGGFVSALNFAIHRKLEEHGISIPFPQRDLHVRGGEMRVVLDDQRTAGRPDSSPSLRSGSE